MGVLTAERSKRAIHDWPGLVSVQGNKIMDMGIAGKKGIVCAASKGLGRGCAEALAAEGVELVICARTKEVLEATAEDIRKASGAKVTAIACDITTEEGRAAVLKACPEPDILVNNAGGPPPGDFREWEREDWIKALDGNMLTAIFLIKATVDSMIGRKFGRIVNITSSSVKLPVPYLGMSNGARAGLTGFVAGLARQTVKHNVTLNGLLPGRFETQRLRDNMKITAEKAGRSYDDMYKESVAAATAGRFGTPEEFGVACAYLCSAHAGYITGQNLLMDGGAFESSV